MNCKPNCATRFAKIAVMVLLGIAAMGYVVMSLWNWLVPSLFTSAHEISYLQALGVLALSKILFGGFRGPGGGCRRSCSPRHKMNLSAEEREKLQSCAR
ncbi:hypothetical protein [Leptothrix ochracea]|uniref:hypothetical protein n=1 Tax=Leptothrix ochracea TaxID=735331 RepID=UPI0034E22F6F